jgi:hypothetical protein
MVTAAYSARYGGAVVSMEAEADRNQSHALAVNTIPTRASGCLYLQGSKGVDGCEWSVRSLVR